MGVKGIYGLSGSGIDVESMVKVGMMSKQTEYDKMYKKEVKNTWVKSEYSDFYSSIFTFRNTTLSSYKMQSKMNAMTTASSDSTKVTATANGAAASMSHSVKVTTLSANAYLLSEKAVSRSSSNTDNASSIYMRDVAYGSFTKNSDGTYTTTDKDGKALDTAVEGSSVALSFTMSDGVNEAKTISYTFDDLNSGKTLNDLASSISKSGLNIQAGYDTTNDAFTMYNKSGGKANTISITAGSDSTSSSSKTAAQLLSNLNLMVSAGDKETSSTASTDSSTGIISFTAGQQYTLDGKNGNVTIDNKTYDSLTSNKLTVAGVTYTFVNTTATDTNTSITVTQDTDTIISNVKQFVTDYNKMLDSLNDKIYETQYSDYEPLTKSQEASMTADQVTKWNEKAKSGLLYHSTVMRTIVSDMRSALSTPVDSVDSEYNSASAIGITSTNYKGHITLDEDKLKKALAADPNCVYQVFASSQDSSINKTDDSTKAYSYSSNFANTGIANRLYDVMQTGMDTIKSYAGTDSDTNDQSYLGKLITNMQTKMSDFKVQMDAYEDILYKKYDAMETAISNLSAQLSTVTGS